MADPAAAAAAAANALAIQRQVEAHRQSDLAKLPLFAGDSKDTFSAEQWIERIDRARTASNWNDGQTMAFVFNALRANALLWYDSLRRTGVDRDNWAQFRDAFLESWSTTRTARTATVNLADLRQGQNESVVCYYPRVVKAVDDLEALIPLGAFPIPATPWPAAFTEVDEFVAIPVADRAAAAQYLVRHGATAAFNHMALNLFVSNLKPAIRDELLKTNPATLYEAFQQAIQLERLAADPKRVTVHAMAVEAAPTPPSTPAIATTNDDEDIDAEINALNFKLRSLKNKRDGGRRNEHRPSGQNANRPPRQAQRSTATRDSVCYYCKKLGHFQDVCRSRLRDGAPTVRPPQAQSGQRPAAGRTGQHKVDQVDQTPQFVYMYPQQQDFPSAEY